MKQFKQQSSTGNTIAQKKKITLLGVLGWLDDHILLILCAFLLAFIPLWPKIPVWSPIEQYIVRVRLEDFFILLAAVVWIVQVLRRKATWRSPMFWWILAYSVVATLSFLSAMFITKTIPLQPLHVEKSALHLFRYMEYFSLFFVACSAIKTRKDLILLIGVFTLAVIGISIYGFGQKYYYWPVYSTMNREFSKGVRLVLTAHARVQSTFAGHYDMGAYLVIALPILLALAYQTKNRLMSTCLHITFWVGTWLLIESASRSSFVAFLPAIMLAVGFTALQRKKWGQKIRFALSRGLLITFVSIILFAYFGMDLADRLNQIIDSNPVAHDVVNNLNKQRKDLWANIVDGHSSQVAQISTLLPQNEVPKDAITTDQAVQMGILSPSDETPVAGTKKPEDVYVNVPDIQQVATKSADGSVSIISVDKGPRTYSANALAYGLSLGIRLDTLWPNAMRGFWSNPLLGKGYATLNKTAVDQFTEAESTDNNFLRTLGETGALGFVTFYGAVAVVLIVAVDGYRRGNRLEQALSIGMFCATVGLLLNAVYIDVFASSKVAETYWALAGLFLSYTQIWKKEQPLSAPKTIKG